MENNHIQQQEESSFDIKSILALVVRKWHLYVIALILTLSTAYLYLRYSQPIYNVKTTLLIKDDKNNSQNPELLRSLELFDQIRNIQNEIEILKSFQTINKTLKRLDFEVSYFRKGNIKEGELYGSFPIKIILDTTFNQTKGVPFFIRIKTDSTFSIFLKTNENNSTKSNPPTDSRFEIEGKYGQLIKSKYFSGLVEKTDRFSSNQSEEELYFIINDLESLTEQYLGKLDIQQTSKTSSILLLQVSGPIIEKEIKFLDKLTEVYIEAGLDEKNRIAINTINFIDQQLFEITDSLKGAENQLEKFRKSEKVMNLTSAADNAFDQMEKLEQEKAMLVVKDKYYKYLLDYVKNNYDINKLVAPSLIGINDPLLNKLIADLYTLNSEQASLKFSATEKNPTFELFELKIESVKKALVENLSNLIQSSSISLTDIDERINKVKDLINRLPSTERSLVNIQRKFNLNDNIYNYLLEKRAEAGLAKAANTPDSKVIDKAMLFGKNPVFPNTKKVWLIAFLAGILIPSLLIFIKNYFNDTITQKEVIERNSRVPILGVIGHYKGSSPIPLVESPKSLVSESFRSLRVNLQYLNLTKKCKVIGVTSSISGEGKTFFALNLATSISITGEKVILIGGDLRKPKLNINLNISNEKGISSYLINKSDLKDIIQKTSVENLDAIPSGPTPPNPTELLGSPKTNELLEALSKVYDYIIIDAPPVGLVADYFLISKYTDANLFLIRQNYTKSNMISELNEIYKTKKLPNLFIVFNDLKSGSGKYGYGYGYGYGYYEEKSENVTFLKKLIQSIKKTIT